MKTLAFLAVIAAFMSIINPSFAQTEQRKTQNIEQLKSLFERNSTVVEVTSINSEVTEEFVKTVYTVDHLYEGVQNFDTLTILLDKQEIIAKIKAMFPQDGSVYNLEPGKNPIGVKYLIAYNHDVNDGILRGLYESVIINPSGSYNKSQYKDHCITCYIDHEINGVRVTLQSEDDFNSVIKEVDQINLKTIKKNGGHSDAKTDNGSRIMNPQITSVSTQVVAGVGEILVITGTDLGSLLSTTVEIENRISAFGPPFIEFDNFDLSPANGASISSQEISFRLPSRSRTSFVSGSIPITGDYVIHSGRVRVLTRDFSGNVTTSPLSGDYVDIPTNVKQDIIVDASDNSLVANKADARVQSFDSDDIVPFIACADVVESHERMAQINTAIKDWKCQTGIDLRVVAESNCVGVSGATAGRISTDPAGGGLSIDGLAACSDSERAGLFAAGFAITDDNSGARNPEVSFRSTARHEIGHILGLEHTIPAPDFSGRLMTPGPFGPLFGISESSWWSETITGADLSGASIALSRAMSSSCTTPLNLNFVGDYAMRDNAGDIGREPNVEALRPGERPDVYKSPDLFNCLNAGTNSCSNSHQDPLEGNPNYIHANVTNISGCEAREGVVQFYWTIGSTGEIWPTDWDNAFIGSCMIGDFIGSRQIGFLSSGESRVVDLTWTPPIIDNLLDCGVPRYPWDEDGETYQICLLARILDDDDYIFLEQTGIEIEQNVFRSNNLVTRNTKLVDDPDLIVAPGPGEEPCYYGYPSNFFLHNSNEDYDYVDIIIKLVEGSEGTLNAIDLLLNEDLASQISSETNVEVGEDGVVSLPNTTEVIIPNIFLPAGERYLSAIRTLVKESEISNYSPNSPNQEISVTLAPSVPDDDNGVTNPISGEGFVAAECYFEIQQAEFSDAIGRAQASSVQSPVASSNQPEVAHIYSVTGQLLSKRAVSGFLTRESLQETLQYRHPTVVVIYFTNVGEYISTQRVVLLP